MVICDEVDLLFESNGYNAFALGKERKPGQEVLLGVPRREKMRDS